MSTVKVQSDLWQTTYSWLRMCNNKLNSSYCKEEITTHPDYPALVSTTDFLDSGGIEYKAVQADASYIHEFNYPLLAHIRQPGLEYMFIIHSAGEWDKQKEITQYWTGIVVYLEKNSNWKSDQNNIYEKKAVKNNIIEGAFVATGVILFIISVFYLHDILKIAFGFFSLLGLIVSFFALGAELGFQNQSIKQVCGGINKNGCEKVLESRYAKGVFDITPADVSALYFTTQFIMYFLGCWFPSLSQSIFLFAFGGIAVVIWSIYTQAIKLKTWCTLCLAIVSVLLIQTIIAFTHSQTVTNYWGLTAFPLLLFVFLLFLLPIKQLIKINTSNKLKLAELKKWKLDGDLFIMQWQKQQSANIAIWQNDLLLGDPDAPLQITVACNTYCGPCAEAHKQLEDLLVHFKGKIKVQMRFLFTIQDENNKLTIAVKAILQKATSVKSNVELQQMLKDWFEWMNYDKWILKWRPDKMIKVEQRMEQHDKWIKDTGIMFTPTFFINGKKLPGRYSLGDIEILIPQLTQMANKKLLS